MIILDKNPEEYFFDELQQAQRTHSIYLSKDLEYYLAQLLSSFAYAKPYQANATNIFETPLALIHQKALESKPSESIRLYKQLGDQSLYVGGFFVKSLEKKVVGIDYYIAMGSAAYSSVSTLSNTEQLGSLYKKLSEEFDLLVYLLNQMAKEKLHRSEA